MHFYPKGGVIPLYRKTGAAMPLLMTQKAASWKLVMTALFNTLAIRIAEA
jgi:hypothetical protein